MKKITTLFAVLCSAMGFAQVKSYSFSQTTGAYTELTTADGTAVTVLGDSKSDAQYFIDPAGLLGGLTSSGAGFSIGFDFLFNGDTYNLFGVSNEGWISLGSTTKSPKVVMTVPNPLQPLSAITTSADFHNARIAALANDLVAQAGSSLTYGLQGTAPNRVLVIQWKNYRKKTGGEGDSFNFQIRLKETSNVVEFDYGTFVNNENPLSFQVGLRGGTDSTLNFSNRSSSNGWGTTLSGTNINDTMLLSNAFKPESGTVFRWTPGTCGGFKALASSVSSNAAVISWGAYTPAPSGYEYVVSTSSDIPTTAGTAVTATTANLSGLSPNTTYNVFLKTNCNTLTTPWALAGSFTTCPEATSVSETFNYNGIGQMPACWSKTGSTSKGTVAIGAAASAPSNGTTKLSFSLPIATNEFACAMLPAVSNLQTGNYQLRFKAAASDTGKSVQVGYFTDAAGTNFTQISGGLYPLDKTYKEFTLPITAIPAGVKNLVFRVTSGSTFTSVFVDDVSYELKNDCPNVSALLYGMPTDSSLKVKWTKGASETNWQYVYAAASSAANPGTLNAVDVTGGVPEVTIGSLNANTIYNVWVRTVCPTSGYGNWIGPLAVSTACSAAVSVMENFDTTSGLPNCWTKVSATGSASVSTTGPAQPNPALSNSNKLWINGLVSGVSSVVVVGLPGLSTFKTPNYQLKMNLATDNKDGAKFEIGYLTDLMDFSSFKPLYGDISCAETKVFEYRTFNLGTVPAEANYMAFRVTGNGYYIDDLVWEPQPVGCPNLVSSISTVLVKNGNATLKWKPGKSELGAAESNWKYVLGSATDTNPYLLSAKNFANLDTTALTLGFETVQGTIGQLSPNTVYKVWIKSVCDDTHSGSYVGPYTINTTCDEVSDFSENFDFLPDGQKLPNCWIVPAASATVTSGTPSSPGKAPSGSTILSLGSSNVSGVAKDGIISLPAVNNYNDGTHMLVFYYRTSVANSTLDVGFMKNPLDATSFFKIEGASFPGNTGADFKRAVVIVPQNLDISTPILAFRNNGSVANTANIDNVSWEPIPACPDIKDLKLDTFTHNSITASWTTGSDETQWQYVIGNSNTTDPLALTPVVVNDTDAVSTNNVVSITNLSENVALQPKTTYKVWVRSRCNTGKYGNFVGPLTVTTTCGPTDFYEDFESTESFTMPNCWQKVGTQGTAYTFVMGPQLLVKEPGYNRRLYLLNNSVDAKPVVSMPTIDVSTFDTHILKFRLLSLKEHSAVEVGFLTNATDPNSFVAVKKIDAGSDFPSVPVVLNKTDLGGTALSSVLAFRNAGIVGATTEVYLDNISWSVAPTAAPACVEPILEKNACGNLANKISWAASPGADGYKLTVGTTPGGHDIKDNVDLGNVLESFISGNSKTTYYYTVAAYNYAGTSTCTEKSFVTGENDCFCVSKPTSMDAKGITQVNLAGRIFNVSINANEPFYRDFSTMPVNVAKAGEASLRVKLNFVEKTYNMGVWVDFNDDNKFDASEKVSDLAATSETDASFSIPANAKTGLHYMRLACKEGTVDPCYNGEFGETIDFKVNVVEPIANDESTNAIYLIPGTEFTTNPVEGSNINATNSKVGMPVCGDYGGADVWYRAIVPSTGRLTFEINSVNGGLTNTAAKLYSGSSLADANPFLLCDDSSSTAGDDHPKITVKDRTPGEVLYMRVWENGGNTYGAFKVSAYDAALLGTDIFNTENFSYYPNPVKDILNISFGQQISHIAVVNLLGQTIIEKTVNANQSKVDMSGLSNGAYLVKVASDNQIKTIKVIKE